ncbi:MAG: hypothetical protein PHG06_00130 [Parabacteroides sp.]|nr:hypothetical protein [Parabacteroides sp.]
MPIIDGEYITPQTANQLDELFFNINFGSVEYKSLQPTTTSLFTNRTVAASGTATSAGVPTGNNAKMSVSFAQTGMSTNCTMNLYGSDHEDLSIPRIIATLTLGAGTSDGFAIDPIAIPVYTYCTLINNDSAHTAIGTVEITTWKEPTT